MERTFFAQLESVIKDCFILIDDEFEEDNTCKMSDNSRAIVQQAIMQKTRKLNIRLTDVLNKIADNLDECQTTKQVELYVIDLLRHFKEYSDRFHPDRLIKVQEENIAYLETDKCGTNLYEKCKREIERLKDRANKYHNLCFTGKRLGIEKDTAEDCLIKWIDIIIYLAKRLDVLLLERGCDLLLYQDKIGIYLMRQEREAIDTGWGYLGGIERTRELIQAVKPNNNDKEQEKVIESSSITRKKSTRKKKIQNFSDIIQYHDKKELLKRLHFLIDCKGGADVGAVIQKAKMDGYLTRYPYEGEFRQEFEVIGSWKAISNYFNEGDNNCLAKSADVIIFKDKISN